MVEVGILAYACTDEEVLEELGQVCLEFNC
jgi:hypothetical protein